MKKQYAVFGLGSFGESVAITLQSLGCDVVAVDSDMNRVDDISEKVSYAMQADIHDPEVIRSMGARNLDGVVVAVAENMEASIMATLISKEIGVPYVVAKAKNEMHATILKKIGADSIVFPEHEMGVRLAKNLMSSNFADWIALSSDYSIMEVVTPKAWVGKSLIELQVREKYGVTVVGMKEGEQVEVSPNPNKALEEGMELILVGANDALEKI